MKGININDLGKTEKNKNILVGECIFPFQYKGVKNNECFETDKGKICATSVSKRGTLKTYGYCRPMKTSIKLTKNNSSGKYTRKSNSMKTRSNKTLSPNPINSTKIESSVKKKSLNSNMSQDKTEKNTPERLNELFINSLSELNDIFIRKGEPFRGRAYKKAEETIILQPNSIYDHKELKGLPNIGDTILSKLKELQETGTLRVLERERNDPIQLFTNIHGIGPKKAQSLVNENIKTIEDLKSHTNLLNDTQKLGIQYYEDINKRIPRDVIDTYKEIFNNSIKELNDENIVFEIVGSYRRGAKSSGDIDIIISDKNNNSSIFTNILDKFKSEGIIKEFLTKGKIKSLTIAQIPGDIARRVDFLYAPPNEHAFAILYFTGSKGFNTVMRHKALQMGYSLNEHGISKMNDKTKGDKISFMEFPNEKSIFDFFKMEYKEPEERKDGSAVISLNGTPVLTKTVKPIKSVKQTKKQNKKSSEEKKELSFLEKFVVEFRKKGISYLNGLTEKEIETVLHDANETFFNNVSVLSDSEYDIVKEYMEEKYPTNKMMTNVGAPVIDKNKVTLPYYMGSMDKIKPDTNAIVKWKEKYEGPYVISAKLDGVSGLYSTENGIEKLYTRGDGKIGQDISYFIPYLRLPKDKDIVIRGEFIINRHIFEEKYKNKFSNPRNFVSGMINAKSIDVNKFSDIEFVAYEVIKPEVKPSEQMKLLNNMNVVSVINEIKENVDNNLLSEMLVSWRESYKYESDGIIVTNDKIYERVNKNPDHSFAFKMVLSEQIAEAKVIDVIWSASKDGYLKPKVQIEPVILGGATIQYATAHNAANLVEKKLGIGAIIKIIRSGDVIPYIMETIIPAESIKMPEEEYVWNETHIDIMLVNTTDNKEILHKNITGFFTGINVEGLSSGNISRIIDSGYNSVQKIIDMSKDDFLTVEGFKEKLATKIYDSIHLKLKTATIENIMSASNIFGHGFGEKKIKLIMSSVPDILTSEESSVLKIKTLSGIKGMASKTAEHFVEKIPDFIKFVEETKLQYKLYDEKIIVQETYDTNHPLYSKIIVFTGIREKNLMQELEQKFDVKLSSSISKNTFAVIAKSKDDSSSKITKANQLNIPVYEIDEFKLKYKL